MKIAFAEPPIEPIPFLSKDGVTVNMLRLDSIHPIVSGNKWYKLQHYIEEALFAKKKIITYGGVWSNHLIATAAACQYFDVPVTGIIKGSPPRKLTATLTQVKRMGMNVIFTNTDAVPTGNEFIQVPMGGHGIQGALGAATIYKYGCTDYTHIICAVGSGTTMAGLINAAHAGQVIVGISALKNCFSLEQEIEALLTNTVTKKEVLHDYHFGGFARHTPQLIEFMNDFYKTTSIPLDIVYTGKMMYAVYDLITKKYFPTGSRILTIHSGGLQGNQSLDKGMLLF